MILMMVAVHAPMLSFEHCEQLQRTVYAGANLLQIPALSNKVVVLSSPGLTLGTCTVDLNRAVGRHVIQD